MNKIKMIAAMFIAGILLTFVSCGDTCWIGEKMLDAGRICDVL